MGRVLRALDLVKRFGKVSVLNGLSFEVPEGSIFGLVGLNGAGKTTTLKVAMNILQPSSGYAEVFGVDSRRLAAQHFSRIGYVSENQEMPQWMTVEYLLAYLKPFYPTWDDARAEELIRRFGLPRDRRLCDLSRGMWMKASLASSLAHRPSLLVLDEPFSGLDVMVREDLLEGILDSAGETTILISSHDLADIETFVSHIGFLECGRLRLSEEMASLSARFREVEVTVDSPGELPAESRWPATWLHPESAAALVRFVETRFDAERTTNDIRALFGDVHQIAVRPMPLKAIFLTLARSASKAA